MTAITGGEALLLSLKRHGVDTVFGLVGHQLGAFYNSWLDHPEVREIGVRHEQAAAYMALGYAWVTGRPGVCATVSGPGALNTATALGTAAAGSIPLLLVSGQVSSDALSRGKTLVHQLDSQSDIFRRLLKGSHVVRYVEEIPAAVGEAFHVMTSGRPGPYELEFPMDILAAKAEVQFSGPLAPLRIEADQAVVERAAREIAQAHCPVILAGGGVALSSASEELRGLAELLHAPVYTSFKGKGVLPDDHPQCMGASGDAGGATTPIDPQADLVLALGTRMNSWTRGPRTLPPGKRVIQIDIDPAHIGSTYPVALPVVGDLRRTLGQLLGRLRGMSLVPRPQHDWAALRQQRLEVMRQAAPEVVGLLERLRRVLPRNAIVAADVTVLGGWSGVALDMYEPQSYLTSTYFATLGLAFPAALGAKLAHPDRPVVAISGDGAFLFNVQELSTAARYGLAVVTIVTDNGGFGTIKVLQEELYGRGKGYELTNPDWVRLAEAFGVRCFVAEGLGGVAEAVDEALRWRGPTLVAVKCPVLPPYSRGRPKSAAMPASP